jgi:hypothetical protein
MYTLIKIAREEQEIKLENNSIGTRLTYLQVLTSSVFLFVCLLGQIRKGCPSTFGSGQKDGKDLIEPQ